MQRVIRRVGLPFVVVAALTLLTVSAASLILAVGYRNQLVNLKNVIYARCIQRQTYDAAAHDSAVADLAEQQALIRLTTTSHGDRRFTVIFTRKAAKDRLVIAHGVLGHCAAFK